MTLNQLFDICEEIELGHAKLYAHFSLLLGGTDDRIARFWEHMSTEEWGHYIVLNFGRALCAKTLGADTFVNNTEVSNLIRLRDRISKYQQGIHEEDLTLSEAFKMAIEFETSEANVVYAQVVGLIREAISKSGKPYLLNRITVEQDHAKKHIEGLVQAVKRFSQDPDLARQALGLLSKGKKREL